MKSHTSKTRLEEIYREINEIETEISPLQIWTFFEF